MTNQSRNLKRVLSLPLLTFYGLGSIIGAGIYVLVGEVATVAGAGMAMSFLIAGLIAALTGTAYAELSARYPVSAGAAMFVDEAFHNATLSRLLTAMLLLTGVISSAAICQGFIGYFQLYVPVADNLIIAGLCLVMFLIAGWGIRESAWLISIITIIEISGLLIVIQQSSQLPVQGTLKDLFTFPAGASSVVIGSFIAFYAFIGFEDMVNVAEEVINPEVTMPLAILLAVLGSSLLYLGVATAAILYTNLEEVSQSTSPLAVMVGHNPRSVHVVSVISMVAIINGALVQIIMAARVMYGMAERKLLPGVFARINPWTQTPLLNTLIIAASIMLLAMTFPLVALAKVTSAFMLLIFATVNISLIKIKLDRNPYNGFMVPMAIPILALVFSIALLFAQLKLE